MKRIAVIDIGKTNAKLALVDAATLEEVQVLTRPNRVLPGPPWPHFDLEGHWQFLCDGLKTFGPVDAISVTTHGASAVGLDASGRALPMLDYEFDGPGGAEYDGLRPDFAATGSPRLGIGLNLGAQLAWLAGRPEWRPAQILTYPGYWGYLLTGQMSCDVTSLGCHTDLWEPGAARWSALVDRLGIGPLMAPPRRPDEVLGGVTPEVAARTGQRPGTPVTVGIHDSNASLYPHVKARKEAFSVVSTGTWVVVMTMGGATALDPGRDTLINVNALGQPVPSARFMGGREFEIIAADGLAPPTPEDRAAVLGGLHLLPAVEPGSGPFRGRKARWTSEPQTPGQRSLALSWYLALMTDTCLGLTGASGPVIVEGPFARNADYLQMLAALRPGVEVALSATGTSTGAALLCLKDAAPPVTRPIAPGPDAGDLLTHARQWHALTRD